MNLIEKINLIDRVHHLIKRKATGDPKTLAKRLDISERSVYNLICIMKRMDAPIYYCSSRSSFCYEQDVEFHIGFQAPEYENGANSEI